MHTAMLLLLAPNSASPGLMSCLAPESESGATDGVKCLWLSVPRCLKSSTWPGSMVALGLAPLSLGFMVSPLLSSWAA